MRLFIVSSKNSSTCFFMSECIDGDCSAWVLEFVKMAACLSGSVNLARSSSMWAENREAAFCSHHSLQRSHCGKHPL